MIKLKPTRIHKRKMALLIPARDEELFLARTVNLAVRAGQKRRDIYIVDDASTDATRQIALEVLCPEQVLHVEHSGKAKALKQLLDQFEITKRYRWVHIADADSVFGTDYFRIFRKALNKKYIAATGYIQSLPGDYVSRYRVYEYAWGMEIIRRFQNLFGVIPVIPGPTSCFRSDIIEKLDFGANTLTEDFDLTLQIHRQKLGRIQFIPKAKTFTQDPKNFHDFRKQINRWYRGLFVSLRRHRIGTKAQKIDIYISYLLIQAFLYCFTQLVYIPAMAFLFGQPYWIALAFLGDLLILLAITVWAALLNRRPDIVAAFPLFYLLRWTYMLVLLKAFIEVIILKRYINDSPGWETRGRRYQLLPGAVERSTT